MNNDLISREALKKAIRKTWLPLNKEWLIMTLDEIIDNAPTVERPQGEWKGNGFVFCNQCGCSHGTHKTNFCPNCGAKMKGGAE